MEKFTVIVEPKTMAQQIADLLNRNNRLKTGNNASTIYNNGVNYIVEQSNNVVVGCIGMIQLSKEYTLLKHLSVHEGYRRRGIAKRLLTNALNRLRTPYVMADIRSDNYPSLKLFEDHGFLTMSYEKKNGYFILTVGKICQKMN